MTAIKKEELERLEREYGLEEDGLTYQHRCSRITAVMKGEEWNAPEKPESRQQAPKKSNNGTTISKVQSHPLYGKRILITPLMVPDAKRNIAFDEPLGPQIVTRDFDAGEKIYGTSEDVQQMTGSYEIVSIDHSSQVIAKTTFPKIGTELSFTIGKDLVPVVRGNDNNRGYIWSLPTQTIQVDDTLIQIYGLKTLIANVYPELLPQFKNKPMMTYIDGVTLAASIPQTEAVIKEHTRKVLIDERAGITY